MKILLLCSFGVSVDVLKKRMLQQIKEEQLDYTIYVSALSEASSNGLDADIILLTPQVRFNLSKIKSLFPDKAVSCIDIQDFKQGNGKAVVTFVKNYLGNKDKK